MQNSAVSDFHVKGTFWNKALPIVTSSRWSSKSPNAKCRFCSWTIFTASMGKSEFVSWKVEPGVNAGGPLCTGRQESVDGAVEYGFEIPLWVSQKKSFVMNLKWSSQLGQLHWFLICLRQAFIRWLGLQTGFSGCLTHHKCNGVLELSFNLACYLLSDRSERSIIQSFACLVVTNNLHSNRVGVLRCLGS